MEGAFVKGQPATADGNEAQRATATGQDRENPGKEQRNSPGGLRLHEPQRPGHLVGQKPPPNTSKGLLP